MGESPTALRPLHEPHSVCRPAHRPQGLCEVQCLRRLLRRHRTSRQGFDSRRPSGRATPDESPQGPGQVAGQAGPRRLVRRERQQVAGSHDRYLRPCGHLAGRYGATYATRSARRTARPSCHQLLHARIHDDAPHRALDLRLDPRLFRTQPFREVPNRPRRSPPLPRRRRSGGGLAPATPPRPPGTRDGPTSGDLRHRQFHRRQVRPAIRRAAIRPAVGVVHRHLRHAGPETARRRGVRSRCRCARRHRSQKLLPKYRRLPSAARCRASAPLS